MASPRLACLLVAVTNVLGSGGDAHVPPLSKIVGGREIDIKDVPYQVYLRTASTMCGGVIISERWVLTAAHCTLGHDPRAMTVRVGSNNKSSGGDEYAVEKVVIHPQYLYNQNYDISAMRISEIITFNSAVKPVTLPKLGAAPPAAGSKVNVSGWGLSDGDIFPEKLKGAENSVLNFSSVEKCLPQCLNVDKDLMLFLKSEDGSIYSGDSGGPVTKDKVLVGINSAVWMNCDPKIALVLNVAVFIQWIKDTTGVGPEPIKYA